MKRALGVVSFGTSHVDAELTCIRPVEQAIAGAFPEYAVQRAYTSRIIGRMKRERGECVENEIELLARLRDEGYDEIGFVSTHVIPGLEYEKLLRIAGDVKVSEALLSDASDVQWMAALLDQIAAEEQCALLAMGHGTDHAADDTYMRIQEKVSGNVYIASVEGTRTLESILPELEALPERRLVLMPLMLVAGDHARNDLAGDVDGSWKSILTARGFDVHVRMQGLGALKEVQQRYVEKARKAMP